MRPQAELISTGSELLSGRTATLHARTLGQALQRLGLELVRDTTLPDDPAAIAAAVRDALARVDIVLVSGGLGPTEDDLTRDALADALGRRIVMDEPALRALRERYRASGRPLRPTSERQVQILEGGVALPNAVGVAPGQRIELEGKVLFVLPGPPGEFGAVLQDHVLPWLEAHVPVAARRPGALFMVTGLGESDIMARFAAAGFPPAGVEPAYCAAAGRVEVRLSAAPGADADLAAAAASCRALLGDVVYAEDRIELNRVVGRLLVEHHRTVASAELNTGGRLAQSLADAQDEVPLVLGGLTAPRLEALFEWLGVTPDVALGDGRAGPAIAIAMADAVRLRTGADLGVAASDVVPPGADAPDRPAGSFHVALSAADGTWVRGHRIWATKDERAKAWAVQMALDLIRRKLLGLPCDFDAEV